MVFSSLEFIFMFLPFFLALYYLTPAKVKNLTLLLGSLVFYGVGTVGNPEHFILFLTCIACDYLTGRLMELYPSCKKALLILGILFHLSSLIVFKYAGVAVLPIGISFYTFQGISYITDVYRGTIKAEHSLIRFGAYLSMFEQLIAGPIVTYSQVESRLKEREHKADEILKGVGTFIFGLGLKVLLANPLGGLWSDIQAIGFDSITTILAWMGIGAFSLQIYFDFFGYSLMAVGLGKMMGFTLPQNFNHPYTSKTMTEFWRRWHMTLGSWFREYVYIPMGGSKKGTVRTIFNLLVVWSLTGIWHGAGWNFALWGLALFLIISIEKLGLAKLFDKVSILGHGYMVFLIPLSWALFAIDDLDQLLIFFGRLFPFGQADQELLFQQDYLKYLEQYWPFFAVGLVLSVKKPYELLKKLQNKWVVGLLLTAVFGACVWCMYRGLDDPFLYFRF